MTSIFSGIFDGVGDDSGDYLSKTDNGEADEGIKDGVFGFLELVRVTGRSYVSDGADDYECCGNKSGNTDDPFDEVAD